MKRLLKDQTGATAIEYGLIAALIGIAGTVSFQYVGEKLSSKFTTVGACVEAPSNATCSQ